MPFNESSTLQHHEQLSEVIGLIYDSAHQPELWSDLLIQLNALVESLQQHEHTSGATITPKANLYFNLLQPHFQRATKLSNQIQSLQSERDAVSNILNRLPLGIILVDNTLMPRAMNSHAQTILNNKSCLAIVQNKLVSTSIAYTKKLHTRIYNALRNTPDQLLSDHDKSMTITCRNQDAYALHITPSSHAGIETEQNLAAVFIASPHIQQTLSIQSLISTYALTDSESNILQKLSNENNDLQTIASKLDISIHTARTHLKKILHKTGTHSQVELLKKVFSNSSICFSDSDTIKKTDNIQRTKESHILPHMRTLQLSNGRIIEYAEYGDPNGVPVLYFHGILHSRKRFHPYSSYAETNGIRIIAPERPGFGASSKQKQFSWATYSQDTQQLADHLRLERFYILSDGDGGAAALACASALGERVLKTAVIGCMPDPSFEHLDKLLPFDRKLMIVARSTPKVILYPLSKIILKSLKKNNNFFKLMAKDFYITDWEIVNTPEHQEIFHESLSGLNAQTMDGFIDDYFSRLNDWDFSVRDIQTEVHLWHGEHDCFSNIVSAKSIAETLANSQIHLLKDQGHYIFISHINSVLEELTSSTS